MATVLLVDDDDGVREVLRLYAARYGLEVVGEARDGREAVDLAARHSPDGIILDEEMPEMTGLQAMARLRRRSPAAVVVFYCSGVPETKHAALALGASAYLTKSASPKTVMQTMAELLGPAGRPVAT
jgi:two-component system, OmpR family, alkaline phosphatase synthesis response regulator PhoP